MVTYRLSKTVRIANLLKYRLTGIRWVFGLFIANDLNTNLHLLLFDAFRAIVDHCKDLKIIHVSDCLRMTEASLAWLRVRGVAVDVCQCLPETY